MYAPWRGRTSASPRGSIHLAAVGLAQGAPKRLASGSDGEEALRETDRTQPPQSEGAPTRGEGGSARERARQCAYDSGSAGKSCRAARIQPPRREGLLMPARSLASQVGVAPTRRALVVSRATFYRRYGMAPEHQQPRAMPARALCESERERVLETLGSPRFVDRSPAEVVATLLDEGQYLCSERTIHRILAASEPVRERRSQLSHPNYTKPGVRMPRPPSGPKLPLRPHMVFTCAILPRTSTPSCQYGAPSPCKDSLTMISSSATPRLSSLKA